MIDELTRMNALKKINLNTSDIEPIIDNLIQKGIITEDEHPLEQANIMTQFIEIIDIKGGS